MEIWKDIAGFEGRYQVSDLGCIRSRRGKILSPSISSRGYRCVTLYDAESRTWCLVHRLVALAFIPNPDTLDQVNHIDCDKSNNSLRNLEWASALDNHAHAVANGRLKRGEENGNARLTTVSVQEIKAMLSSGKHTKACIARRFEVSHKLISMIGDGRAWAHI